MLALAKMNLFYKKLVSTSQENCLDYTEKNTVISTNILAWNFCGKAQFWALCPKLCRNCAFPQNVHARKLGEITVFFALLVRMSLFYNKNCFR